MAGWEDVTSSGWEEPRGDADGTPAADTAAVDDLLDIFADDASAGDEGPAASDQPEGADEASQAGDLAAMFGGSEAAASLNDWGPPAPTAGATPAADLSAWTAPPAPEPPSADQTGDAGSDTGSDSDDDLFSELFGADEEPTDVTATELTDSPETATPAAAPAESDAAAAETEAVEAVEAADVPAGDGTSTEAELERVAPDHTEAASPEAASSEPAAAASVPSDVPSDASREPAAAGKTKPKKRLSLADKLARQDAASQREDHHVLEQVGLEAFGAQRYLDADRLWGHVDRMLGYVASQHDLQLQLKDVVITRDEHDDRRQRELIETLIRPRLIDANVQISNTADIPLLFDMLYDELLGLSVLGPLWRDDDITEILVDAYDRIAIERDGSLQLTPIRFRSESHATEVARNLSQKVSDRAVNESNPIVTAELPGARLHFAVGRVVRTGLSISIRKFRPLMGIDGLLKVGALSQEMVEFLDDAIGKGRANVLVSGGTGTGKTTMLNAISSFIPPTERVITIEDSFELTLQNALVVSMQTKEAATQDSKSAVGMADLLRSALRMRPDRIVVGEIRGAEAQVMLQAANTGHDGTMSTVHANDPTSCLSFRLPDMLLQAREMPEPVARRQVASAVDLVVQITRRAGRRFVSAIATVDVTDQTDEAIVPRVIFESDLGPDGTPVHRRVGSLRTDTDLSIKMADYGADVARWAAPVEES